MIDKVKGLMAVGENLDEISKKVRSVADSVAAQSKELSAFKKEVSELKSGIVKLNSESEKLVSSIDSQISGLKSSVDDLKKEVYDFKLIKADIKSKLVSELSETFREELRQETRKLDLDVKNFNDLKNELSVLVGKFKSVELEIEKFRSIAQNIKAADFELTHHARELAKADQEKLTLMQKIDQLERLLSKLRRQGH